MSAPKILAQSVCPHISLGGLWVNPVLCRVKFTSASSGASVSVDAESTPGFDVDAYSTNHFPVTFPTCRKAEFAYATCEPATEGTVGNHRDIKGLAVSASGGTASLFCVEADGTGFDAPEDASIITAFFWLDLG